MTFKQRKIALVAAAITLIALAAGCSEIEPQTGTRVTFALESAKSPNQEKIRALSQYLIRRSEAVLDVDRARVESVTNKSLVLLLPGKKVEQKAVDQLLVGTTLDFYHLNRVATVKNPARPWHIKLPSKKDDPYIFTSQGQKPIDSRKDSTALLTKVIGSPAAKPILTSDDILTDASAEDAGKAWVVLIHFTNDGAKIFEEFTRKNKGEYVAILYNNSLMSVPQVAGPIKGDKVFLTGFKSKDQAENAVIRLNAGPIPIPMKIKSVKYY